MARIDKDELRSMVRQALKETLGTGGDARAEMPGDFVGGLRAALARGKPAGITVGDLNRFARDILAAGDHADLRAAIAAGDVRFELAGDEKRSADKPPAKGGAYQMKSGVLGETRFVELARTHTKILLGSDVVVTPLAREKARQMKVELVRQKQ